MTLSTKTTGLLLAAALAAPGLSARAQDMAALKTDAPPANAIWLDSLDISKMSSGYMTAMAGKSIDGAPITLAGNVFPHGVGTHAVSEFRVSLHGAATRFASVVGIDDEKNGGVGSVTFTVLVDGKRRAGTPTMRAGDKPRLLSVDLTGAKTLILRVGDAGDGVDSDHADWAGAEITLAEGATAKPEAEVVPVSVPRLTVPPINPAPEIHGARIVGGSPGKPFLFLIPVTGDGPLTYSAKNLPAGLSLDGKTGIISGSLKRAGSTDVEVSVKGAKGEAKRILTIVGGDHKLALTPPMGWNSWNVWAGKVDADKVKAAADEMVSTGLAGHGYGYINIDDTWEAGRDAQGRILTNEKFPDMKGLGDYIHSKGLKFGIYSSPGPKTCANFEASYQHEDQDAQSYAAWGVDYLKYDWCSYDGVVKGDHSLAALELPYAKMGASLLKTNRDILYSFCQYGMGDVWKWGERNGGNAWRTTGDIQDNWGSLHGIYEGQDGHQFFAGPGHWNDPDMLMVGIVGFGNTHPTHLTPNEQILHISMWCMLSSPLLIGCDMTRFDPFTLAILSNDEVLDINQDPLGRPAGRIAQNGDQEIWARPLFDGTKAVALVNGGGDPATINVRWSDLEMAPGQPVRDLWMHQDLGPEPDGYSVEVPAHGCVVLKVGKAH
jgi:alpha-galactosidase